MDKNKKTGSRKSGTRSGNVVGCAAMAPLLPHKPRGERAVFTSTPT